MVVLESGGMVTIGNNQYLQPDYLSPLPTTLDAKKSPLALLAQTCSQIGADSSNVKTLITLDKNKKSELSKSPTAIVHHKMEKSPSSSNLIASTTAPTELKLAFKPYETNVLTRKTDDHRPPSKDNNCFNDNINSEKEVRISARVPSRNKSESPLNNNISVNGDYENGKLSPNNGDRKSVSPSNLSQRGASPIIRSGLEILQGHSKDLAMSMYKPSSYGMNTLSGMGFPPGMEQHTNPAFRPPFAGGYTQHHAAMLAAISGYSNSQAPPGTFVSYARVKTPSGGEALVPVCKDPYCTGCQFSAHNQQALMGSPCPSGCTQCEHQKYGFAMAMSGLPPGHPYAQMGRPYICNWIIGESYCGKRYNSSEELLQHLRTHTSNLSDPAAAAAALAASSQASLLSPLGHLFSQSALHRAYTNPPLSPLSASRYHPYGKPGSLPPGLNASAYSGFNPGFSYYSPYALYGQRIATTAVHP